MEANVVKGGCEVRVCHGMTVVMVLFTKLCKLVLPFESVDETVTIQLKATEQYFPMVLFIIL